MSDLLFDQKLQEINQQFEKGLIPSPEPIRSVLSWFGVSRRGWRVCTSIREKLDTYGLETIPEFESAFIDDNIQFRKKGGGGGEEGGRNGAALPDPTFRIRRLSAANKAPITIPPDAPLQKAVTLLMENDFSQLPVMTNERDVKGMVGWKTIGSHLAMGKSCAYVRDCMTTYKQVSIDDSFLDAISVISQYGYVLVRSTDNRISGIITSSDFTWQFKKLAEPFLLVGEIENGVRRLLHGKFSKEDITKAAAPGDEGLEIESLADLTFGGYIRLIESEDNWAKLAISIDRYEFVTSLDKVRKIRNDVMHFDPDGLEDKDVDKLMKFAAFLKSLRDMGIA